MNAWYLSYERFEKRIKSRWDKKKVKYNRGNVNILKYSYKTLMFWTVVKEGKISKSNKKHGHPRLF